MMFIVVVLCVLLYFEFIVFDLDVCMWDKEMFEL